MQNSLFDFPPSHCTHGQKQKYNTAAIINNNMSLTSVYFSLNWNHYFLFYEHSILGVFSERRCLSRCLIIRFIRDLNVHIKCFLVLCFHVAYGCTLDPRSGPQSSECPVLLRVSLLSAAATRRYTGRVPRVADSHLRLRSCCMSSCLNVPAD